MKSAAFRPTMFVSIPEPEISLPISSMMRRSACANGSLASHSFDLASSALLDRLEVGRGKRRR